jgi:hypothetical protein
MRKLSDEEWYKREQDKAAGEVAYCSLFKTKNGKLVLEDLRDFCMMDQPIENDIDEGARRVFLRIKNFLDLGPSEIKRKSEDKIKRYRSNKK